MPAQGPQAECRGDWEDPQSASRVVHGKANERHTWVAEASYSEWCIISSNVQTAKKKWNFNQFSFQPRNTQLRHEIDSVVAYTAARPKLRRPCDFFGENAVYHWIWYLFQHILKGFILFGHLFNRKWKYNEKIDQHYVEVDESGELTKKYIQTKEEEEVSHTDKPVEFKKLTLDDPAAIDRGSEAEAYAETQDGKPDAEVESQDRFT